MTPRAPARVEALIAGVLLWGGLISIAVVVVGLVLYASGGGFREGDVGGVLNLLRSGATPGPGPFASLGAVLRGLSTEPVEPLAVVALGLVLLLATPLLGVAAAIPAFIAAGDRRYAAVASAVLSLLILSLIFSGGIG